MEEKKETKKKPWVNARNIVLLLLAVLVLIFVLQNTQSIEVKFLPWKVSLPSGVVVLGVFFIGLLVGWLPGKARGKRHS